MSIQRHLFLLIVVLLGSLVGFGATSCQQEKTEAEGPDWMGIFGNGYRDPSPVICRIGDLAITQNQLEMRYEEMPNNLRKQFSGEGWERRLLRFMVDEALLVREATQRKLYQDPTVSQQLISQYRYIMKLVMRDQELIKGRAPSEEQIREYFELNRDKYMREGAIHARHIPCQTKEDAYEAYDQIRRFQDEDPAMFARIVAMYSTNFESARQAGDLGWFTKMGFIPAIAYGKEFAEKIWDWTIDLHEPVEIGGEWHVIEILEKDFDRPLTLEEARDQVEKDLLPVFQLELLEDFLQQAKAEIEIEYFGNYRVGEGLSPRELFERAWYATSFDQAIDVFTLIVDEYPESELADDALFMMANRFLDERGDAPIAVRYLRRILEEYPHSELAEDSQYILEHIRDPDYRRPRNLEDLKPTGADE
jgi:hypothetical protein